MPYAVRTNRTHYIRQPYTAHSRPSQSELPNSTAKATSGARPDPLARARTRGHPCLLTAPLTDDRLAGSRGHRDQPANRATDAPDTRSPRLCPRNGKTFALTPRVLALGYAYLSSLNLTEIAQPHMERVVQRTHEGCSLATFDDTEVVYVTRVPTHRITSITLATGTRLPAHATSMGHVLLADLNTAELQRYLAKTDLRPLTAHTISRRDDLISRLELVRSQGYAIVNQELEQGLRSVAAPVKDSNGRVIAALALSSMTATTDEQTFREHHAVIIVDAAQQISGELGADFSSPSER